MVKEERREKSDDERRKEGKRVKKVREAKMRS